MPDASMAESIGFPIASVNRHSYYSPVYSSGMSNRGDRFREARGKLSQAALAKKVGVSQPTIAAAEAGGRTEHTVKIALATGYSAYWLESGKGQKRLGPMEAAGLSEDEQRAVRAFITTLRNTPGR